MLARFHYQFVNLLVLVRTMIVQCMSLTLSVCFLPCLSVRLYHVGLCVSASSAVYSYELVYSLCASEKNFENRLIFGEDNGHGQSGTFFESVVATKETGSPPKSSSLGCAAVANLPQNFIKIRSPMFE